MALSFVLLETRTSSPPSSFHIRLWLLTFHSSQKPNLRARSSVLNSSSSSNLISSCCSIQPLKCFTPNGPKFGLLDALSAANQPEITSLHRYHYANFCNCISRAVGLIRFENYFLRDPYVVSDRTSLTRSNVSNYF